MDYKDALACAIVPLVLYCLPLCFYRYLIRGYPLSKKYAIITALIYGFVFSLVFSLIMSAITGITVTPASTSFTALYGLVSYFLLTRGGSHKQTGNDSKTPVNPVEAKIQSKQRMIFPLLSLKMQNAPRNARREIINPLLRRKKPIP